MLALLLVAYGMFALREPVGRLDAEHLLIQKD